MRLWNPHRQLVPSRHTIMEVMVTIARSPTLRSKAMMFLLMFMQTNRMDVQEPAGGARVGIRVVAEYLRAYFSSLLQ